MTTNTMKMVAVATNFNGPYSDTNRHKFGPEDTPSRAIAPPPDKSAILAALVKLIDTPYVFTVLPLTTKARIKAVMGDTAE